MLNGRARHSKLMCHGGLGAIDLYTPFFRLFLVQLQVTTLFCPASSQQRVEKLTLRRIAQCARKGLV